ncbi:MAG: PLP-dependent aminotransferase family protein [Candidatus Izimaplasma sp.]|nr:PLP-dependent aminotransferase family protein [Candidatus Izimaplasma bacterium]
MNYLYEQLYDDLKAKIIKKEFKANYKLESVRKLAKKMGVSTTTIEKAYNQLLAEGYIKSIPRSGYFVVDINKLNEPTINTHIKEIPFESHKNNQFTPNLFDFKSYKRVMNRIINYRSRDLLKEMDPKGEYDLREEIRKYVLNQRDLHCHVDQIVIGPGIQSLLHMLLSLVNKQTVTYLTPEFKRAMTVFRNHNYTLHPQETLDEILSTSSDFLFISPSNIYPTGEVLKAKKRVNLINWAHKNNAFIIEDDYNFFMRYNDYIIPSIHSYDKGENVVYIGSFSKMLMPSIRISYMVLPKPIYDIYRTKYTHFAQGVGKLEQLTIAEFMKDGSFNRHIKKLYKHYKKKNKTILSILKKYNNKTYNVRGTESNLHVVLDFYDTTTFKKFIKNLNKKKFKFEQIKDQKSLILPYSGLRCEDMDQVIKELLN